MEKMESGLGFENDLNLKATELTLGIPGTHETEQQALPINVKKNNKRSLPDMEDECGSTDRISEYQQADEVNAASAKAQIVGWPPVRSYRKNILQTKKTEADTSGMYVKVSMDGAPFLRKIDLKVYENYPQLLKALEEMFKFTVGEYSERDGYKGSEYVPTYEDKDGDWMLVGDVPWEMFMSSCKRLRIMKGSEARGLGCGV